MIPYDFDARFWNPIANGTKRATIRRMRTKPRRHAREGEAIECWAMVDNRRLRIREADCAGLQGIFMRLDDDVFRLGDITRNRSTWPDLDAGGREGLAKVTGFDGWAAARDYYLGVYGGDPFTGTLVTWRDREYSGPKPTAPQMRDLRILAANDAVIPAYGKISVQVGYALLLLKWAEIVDPAQAYFDREKRGHVAIKISELGRWILERFER